MLGSKSQAVTFSETLEQKLNENVTSDQTEITMHGQTVCVCVCLSVRILESKSQAVTFSETLKQKRDENVTADQTEIPWTDPCVPKFRSQGQSLQFANIANCFHTGSCMEHVPW